MLCGICKTKEARIFYTEVVNGEKKEQYLCEECAAKSMNFRLRAPFQGKEFSLGGLLSGLFEGEQPQEETKETGNTGIGKNLVCSDCGMTYEEFKEDGQFGCASCYQNFGRLLLRNIKNIQGSDVHTGKRPKNSSGQIARVPEEVPELSRLDRLTMQLQQAVEQEEFEMAASLRDQIRALKQPEED